MEEEEEEEEKPAVVVFDSHLLLQLEYRRVCSSSLPAVPDDPAGAWLCSSENHSGTAVTRHFARLVLRYCSGNFDFPTNIASVNLVMGCSEGFFFTILTPVLAYECYISDI